MIDFLELLLRESRFQVPELVPALVLLWDSVTKRPRWEAHQPADAPPNTRTERTTTPRRTSTKPKETRTKKRTTSKQRPATHSVNSKDQRNTTQNDVKKSTTCQQAKNSILQPTAESSPNIFPQTLQRRLQSKRPNPQHRHCIQTQLERMGRIESIR